MMQSFFVTWIQNDGEVTSVEIMRQMLIDKSVEEGIA